MMLEEEIYAALSPLTPGNVVSPLKRQQGDAAMNFPGLLYTLVSTNFEGYDTLCGPDLYRVRVQVDCYTNTDQTQDYHGYKGARELAYRVSRALREIGLPDDPQRGGRLLNMSPFPDEAEKGFRWTVEHYFWRNLGEDETALGIPEVPPEPLMSAFSEGFEDEAFS